MNERSQESEGQDEAAEAAQRVADSVESWESTAEESTVRRELDEGLDDAGVEVPDGERKRLVEEIKDEDADPEVDRAEPVDETSDPS